MRGWPRTACSRRGLRAGLTLLEVLLVGTIAAVVVFKVATVLSSASTQVRSQAAAMEVQERARIVLDKLAYQLMGAERSTLVPENTAGIYSNEVTYRISLGVEDGQVIYSEQEIVAYEEEGEVSEVVWGEDVGTADERRVVWTRLVQQLYSEESDNGLDDNGNGLQDEEGLYFVIEQDHVVIGLTLARVDEEGNRAEFTAERFVTIRN